MPTTRSRSTRPTPEERATARTALGKLNIYQRLEDVRYELGGGISIDGVAPAVMGGFKFIKWDDVAEKVGAMLNSRGVVFVPSVRDVTISEAGTTSNGKVIWRAVVWADFQFVNADDPKEIVSISWCGVGDDTSDKAVQKAITSGTKYALLKLFLLSGADDADASDVAQGGVVTANNGAEPPPGRKAGGNAPVFKVTLADDDGAVHVCPECHTGNIEAALWESGRVTLACTNWRGGCKYKGQASVPQMVQVRKAAESAWVFATATSAGSQEDIPF